MTDEEIEKMEADVLNMPVGHWSRKFLEMVRYVKELKVENESLRTSVIELRFKLYGEVPPNE